VTFASDQLWWPLRGVNRVGGGVAPSYPSLELDALLVAAMRRTGLTDLGEGWNRGRAEILTNSLDHEARLTTIGRRLARGHVSADLVSRLRLADAYRSDPSIRQRPLLPPVMIVNLPRSGATLLQFLLARVPQIRSLWAAEALDPVSCAGAGRTATTGKAARRHRVISKIVPSYHDLHPMAADEPEECNALLGRSFDALDVATIFDVPSYLDDWQQRDHLDSYAEMRAQVQLLQGTDEPRHWLLRTPAHLFAIDAIAAFHPATYVVQIHRNPVDTITSFCSLAATIRRANSNPRDPRLLGPRWVDLWSTGLERAMAARDAHPGQLTFIDVRYDDLVRDPAGQVRRVLTAMDIDPESLDEEAITARAESTRSGRRHQYDPGWFGIESGEVGERFRRYTDRFELA
jgi:hypothetical protein